MTDEPVADRDDAAAAESEGAAEREGIVDQQDAVLHEMKQDSATKPPDEESAVNDTESRYGGDESPA